MNPPYLHHEYKDPQYLENKYLGYTAGTVQNSFYYSIRSIQYAYGNKLTDIETLKMQILEKLKLSIIKFKLIEQFQGCKNTYDTFIKKLNNGILPVDPQFQIIELTAQIMSRPFIIISSLPRHKSNQLIKFEAHVQKPPFIFGLQEHDGLEIFLPYFINKAGAFDIKQIKPSFQIVSFWSKAISEQDKKRPIIEKELFAILASLHAMKPMIGQSELLLLTDSKPLFLLYSNPVSESSSKLCRWGAKLAEYPNLTIRFISTKYNLADFLTRDYNITKPDLKRLPLQNINVSNLDDYIEQYREFTIPQWKEFVKNHQHLLTINKNTKTKTILSLTTMNENIKKITEPLKDLKTKMEPTMIAAAQQKEFDHILNEIRTAPNMEGEYKNKTYKVIAGLLYILHDNHFKLYLPESMEGLYIAFHHLTQGHIGIKPMLTALSHLYFPEKTRKITNLCQSCYPCSLQNYATKQIALGSYPVPDYFFQYASMDLIENLPANNTYSHILLIVCPLSKFILCYPLKNKTPDMIMYHFIYGLYQFVNVKYLLTDNAKCFTDKKLLMLLATLNIKKIQLAAQHPSSNGIAESFVKKVKYVLKKTLAKFDEYSWMDILPLIVKQLNSTVNPLTKFSPLELLHGPNTQMSQAALHDRPWNKLYPLLRNHRTEVEQKQIKTEQIIENIRDQIKLQKITQTTVLNKNRKFPDYTVGTYVFVKDRYIQAGTTRPLKTTYSDDPWVILAVKQTTLLVRRLSDGFTTTYGMDAIKKYSRLDPQFSTLPISVREVLMNEFLDLQQSHYSVLRKHATLDLPQGMELFTISEDQNKPEDNTKTNIPQDTDTHTSTINKLPISINNNMQQTQQVAMQNTKPNETKRKKQNTNKEIQNIRVTRTSERLKLQKKDSESDSTDSDEEKKQVKFAF